MEIFDDLETDEGRLCIKEPGMPRNDGRVFDDLTRLLQKCVHVLAAHVPVSCNEIAHGLFGHSVAHRLLVSTEALGLERSELHAEPFAHGRQSFPRHTCLEYLDKAVDVTKLEAVGIAAVELAPVALTQYRLARETDLPLKNTHTDSRGIPRVLVLNLNG